MKYKKTITMILIILIILLFANIKIQAASANITASTNTAEVGNNVTITVRFSAAAWNLKVSGDGIDGAAYASQTDDLSEAETVKTFNLNTSKSGKYTITLKGDITDANGVTHNIDQSCTVTINEKQNTGGTSEKPQEKKEPNFIKANKTMYASKDMNLRETWSTSSKATKIDAGTELTVTATSTNKVNNYVWYKVVYNGKTLYAASNLLTSTKPQETSTNEEPEEPEKIEEPSNEEINKVVTEGLKALEIEGFDLSPKFESGIYEYSVVVKEDITSLNIKAETINETKKVVIAGNDNLQEGENLITLIVYNSKDEVEATYQINVNKNTLDLSSVDQIIKDATKEAKIKAIIFISLITISVIVLIIVLILKHKMKNKYDSEDYEDEEESNNNNFFDYEKEINSEEQQNNPVVEKKKGKHF